MKYILCVIIVILLVLIIISKSESYLPKEHFELNKTQLMDSVHQVARTPSVSITTKELDDTLIKNFIENDMESKTNPMIGYPEKKKRVWNKVASVDDSDSVKLNQQYLLKKL